MEQNNNNFAIHCPLHPSEVIQRIDLNIAARKQVYCVECMLGTDDGKPFLSTLVTISDFISKAAIYYHNSKHKVRPVSDPPAEYIEVLAKQAENIENLTKHINEEKVEIETIFKEITQDVVKLIDRKKNEYLNILEEQILNLSNHYNFFEKQLKRGYFKPEDSESLFPTKEELQKKLEQITNANQLSIFVKSVKEDLNQDKCGINFLGAADESIKAYLEGLKENLMEIQSARPILDHGGLDIHQIITEVNKTINKRLESAFVLKNPVLDVVSDQTYPESSIVKTDDFKLIRSWLPAKHAFNPKLLYRASRDGATPSTFHDKCDGKGPTLTIIKCRFNNSSKDSIIGGFLDKDWHQKKADILSNEAFLFSVTTRVKCPITQPQYAAHGRPEAGPVFGAGCDILIPGDLSQCYVHPASYANSANLIESENYSGSGSIKFALQDIEVYSLK